MIFIFYFLSIFFIPSVIVAVLFYLEKNFNNVSNLEKNLSFFHSSFLSQRRKKCYLKDSCNKFRIFFFFQLTSIDSQFNHKSVNRYALFLPSKKRKKDDPYTHMYQFFSFSQKNDDNKKHNRISWWFLVVVVVNKTHITKQNEKKTKMRLYWLYWCLWCFLFFL